MPGITKNKGNTIQWEEPLCNNCESKSYKIFLDNISTWEHNYKFREVKCEKCGLVYLSPRPRKEYINRFYSSKTYWGIDLSSDEAKSEEMKNRSLFFGRIYKNILKSKKKGSIFDVGFGTGLFLTYFNEIGWNVGGIELSVDAVYYAKEVYKLDNLKSGSIEDFGVKKKSIDVVTFNSSLEHLYSPKKALNKVNEMLKSNGLLVVTVPNLDSLGFMIFKKQWLGLHPPKHLYHFTPATLINMLESEEFEIEKIDHWFWNHSYYSFFESFRYMISPRFKSGSSKDEDKKKDGSVNMKVNNIISVIIKKAGILFAIFFATSLALIGSFIKRGEVITIYARKS